MRKILLPVLFVFALLLSACGSAQTQSTTAPAPTTAATSSAPVSPTPTRGTLYGRQEPVQTLQYSRFSPAGLAGKNSGCDFHGLGARSSRCSCHFYCLHRPAMSVIAPRLIPIFNAVFKADPDDVRLVFRHWPLASIHPNAVQAARAADAAGKQGKFFTMTEFLFTNQSEWSGKSAADFTTWLNGKAAFVGS